VRPARISFRVAAREMVDSRLSCFASEAVMPLYEYRCRKCSRRFETLVFGDEKPACPKCQGRDLEKLWSAFAVAGTDRKSDDFGGGDFGGGDDFGGDMGGG